MSSSNTSPLACTDARSIVRGEPPSFNSSQKESAALRIKIDQMCVQLDQEYDYVDGYLHTLEILVLASLFGHPHANWAQEFLEKRHARHQELLEHPERAQEGESVQKLSASSRLYLSLKNAGVWLDDVLSQPDASPKT